jgi:hypothetical protein
VCQAAEVPAELVEPEDLESEDDVEEAEVDVEDDDVDFDDAGELLDEEPRLSLR